MDPATGNFGNNWKNGPPPAGEPDFFFSAHCSEWNPGHCQVKPFWFTPYNDYKVIGFDSDPTNGYSIVYGCDTYLAGAYIQDWSWVLTRPALVIGTAAWQSMKDTVFPIFNERLSGYDAESEFNASVSGTSEGCIYTPCTTIEVGLPNCPA